jgi:hypothetical protein
MIMMTITKSIILDPNVRTEVNGTTGKEAERTKAYNIVPNSVTLYKEYYEYEISKQRKGTIWQLVTHE